MSLIRTLIVGVVALSSGVARAADQPSPWEPEEFPVSYWCGPPAKFTTLERYKEIKDANFTLAFPIYPGGSVEDTKRQLDLCQQVGLKAFIQDGRVNKGPAAIEAMVKDYSAHPALAGYFVADEPRGDAFPGLGAILAELREKDPKHPGFINLFPTYVRNYAGALGYPTYEEHVRKYVEICKPFAISYDHYFFDKGGDGKEFFENLATVRKVSLETHTPFWNIVQLTEWGSMRNLTEAEMRFEAMQTLAYGGKGLLWFTYWSPKGFDPSNNWQHAAINPDGTRDAHYDMVKHVNAEVVAIGQELLKAESTGVYQIGTVPPFGTKAPADAPVTTGDKVELTVGVLKVGGHTLALITNRDYKAAANFAAKLPTAAPERFDVSTRKWAPLAGPSAPLDIPPGDAIMLRW